MSHSRSRSASLREEDELRLPRPPGVIRRFWSRHPVAADVALALTCLLLSLLPGTFLAPDDGGPGGDRNVIGAPSLVSSITITIMVLIACALLVRRRQWPFTAFVAAYVLALGYLLLMQPAGGLLLLVTSYTLAVYRSTRAAWIGLAIGIGSLTLLSLLLYLTGTITVQIALNGVLGQLTLALIGTLIGVNVGGRKRYLEAVIDRSRQLLVERDQQAQLAAAAERARIAREMHDIVSHSLTVVVALSEGAAATDDRGQARAASDAAADTARGALTEMRAMLGVLRDGGADVPLAPSEPVDPHATVSAAQRAGYPTTLTVTGKAEVPTTTRHAIGRIVQEGVTNAMRHAPNATSISVRITHSSSQVVVDIDNDGAVGETGETGFGLRGLHERATHVGGDVVSHAIGGGRWSLHAELPVKANQDAAARAERIEGKA